jgi:hypothetical protein
LPQRPAALCGFVLRLPIPEQWRKPKFEGGLIDQPPVRRVPDLCPYLDGSTGDRFPLPQQRPCRLDYSFFSVGFFAQDNIGDEIVGQLNIQAILAPQLLGHALATTDNAVLDDSVRPLPSSGSAQGLHDLRRVHFDKHFFYTFVIRRIQSRSATRLNDCIKT